MLQFLPQVIQLAGMVKDMLDDDDNSATPDHAEKSMKKILSTETLGFLDEIIDKDPSQPHKSFLDFLKG